MRCISLWQPYASLISVDLKRIETRSWPTKYRGPVGIHAAKTIDRAGQALLTTFLNEYLRGAGITRLDIPRGAVLCIVDLVDCVPTEQIVGSISTLERAVGNYGPGRWAWKLDNLRVFETPIPTLGRQGFFHWVMPDGVKFRKIRSISKG